MRGIKEKNRQKIRQFATAIKMKTEKIVRSQNAGMFLFFLGLQDIHVVLQRTS